MTSCIEAQKCKKIVKTALVFSMTRDRTDNLWYDSSEQLYKQMFYASLISSSACFCVKCSGIILLVSFTVAVRIVNNRWAYCLVAAVFSPFRKLVTDIIKCFRHFNVILFQIDLRICYRRWMFKLEERSFIWVSDKPLLRIKCRTESVIWKT